MNLLEALLLGIIQGLTEFIPVSSTAHLLIGQRLLGLPANDGTPRVWYSLLTPQAAGITVELRALSYDHAGAAAAIRAADLPQAYADALESGFWPNDDIMPDTDQRRRVDLVARARRR